ncbi:hypothetical protein Bbelb_427760 [Branchiostoma belcheri]|nr:hypothetical protein Bbelb_427760 [Branchiostoma belcheri]
MIERPFGDPFLKQNVPRGYSVRYHDGPLTPVKWKDTRTLIVVSTATIVGAPDVQITSRSKGRGGGVIRQKVQCPAMVNLYNRYYKAVDKAIDQLRSTYEFRRPSKRWHRQLFWYVLNKAVVNAYLNWKAYTTERSAKKLPAHKTAQLRFRRALVRQLVGNFSARRRAPARNPPVAKARRLMPGARRQRPHETIYKCNTCNVSVCRVSLRPKCWREHLEEMRTVT